MIRSNLGPASIYTPTRFESADAPDVVLAQGFFLGRRAMLWHARHLEKHGLRAAIPRLGGLLGFMQTHSVHKAGQRMAAYIKSLPDGCRPWLVGHSLGGIISRYAIQHEGVADRVAGLVTLGSPHRGTPIAYAGMVIGVGFVSWVPWQLTPQSLVIRKLNNLPWPADLPLVAVTSPDDLLCIAPRGEPPFQDGVNVRVTEFPGLGHTELLWHREVLDFVAHTVAS